MRFYWRCVLILLFGSKWTTSFDTDCGKKNFPCDSNVQCVEKSKWCDEHPDCDDKSDEAYCKKATWFNPDPNRCKGKDATHILCDSGICIPIAGKCDGYEDCDDGLDEKNCEVSTTPLDATEASGSNELDIDDVESDDVIEVGEDHDKEEDDKSSSESVEDNSTESSEELLFPKRDNHDHHSTAAISTPTPNQASIFNRNKTFYDNDETSTKGTLPTSTKSSAPFPTTTTHPPAKHYRNITKSTVTFPYHKTLGKRPPMFVNIIPSPSHERPLPILPHHHRHNHHLRMGSRLNNYNNGPYASEHSMWDTNLKPYEKYKEAHKPFYFAKDYASLYGEENSRYLQGGVSWLLKQRNPSGDWGKDTGRALIALALSSNAFPSGNSEYETMKRRFMVQLGTDLLQEEAFLSVHSKEFNINKLARMINALLATCENPQDFHGMDLIEVLRTNIRKNFSRRHYYVNPYVYLTLCLSNSSFSTLEVQNLMKQMMTRNHANEMAKDMQSLAIQAFVCHVHQNTFDDPAYRMSLHETLYNAVSELQQRMFEDGSFGSVYSTALAAQALISVNASIQWEPRKTLDFLKEQQREDGSFGDFLATYYVLPVLSGRSLIHLRNIRCDSSDTARDMTPSEMLEFVGPKQYIHYSIYFGSSLVSSHSLKVLVPQGIGLLDVMRVAEYQDENFRFSLEDETSNVYSLSGVPNDAEQGLFWHLYVKPESDKNTYTLNTREQYNGDIRKVYPRPDQHVIFWYHPRTNPLFT